MPRWAIRLSGPASTTRYLARRRTSSTVRPMSRGARSSATGQRSRGSRTTTRAIRWPSSTGRTPRAMVSTSGSSGTTRTLRPRSGVVQYQEPVQQEPVQQSSRICFSSVVLPVC